MSDCLIPLSVEEDPVNLEVGEQIDLHPRVVVEHPEADRVPAADELPIGIDANVEVVGQEVVVGAVAAVLASQNVGAGRCRRRLRGLRRREQRDAAGGQDGCERESTRKRRNRISWNEEHPILRHGSGLLARGG